MKAKHSTVGCALVLGLAMTMSVLPMAGAEIAGFSVPTVGAGNEGSGEHPIGNDFRVQRPITVTQLGMFDSGGDGVTGSAVIRIELWDSSPENKGGSLLESVTFDAGNPGNLVGGMRYKTLARPVTLLPGHYTLTAAGFDEQNPVYNGARRSREVAPQVVVNDGSGLIQFLGVHHRNDLTLRAPQLKNMGPPDRFAAGSFVYEAAQAPANPFSGDYSALVNGVRGFPVDSGKSNLYGSKIVLNRYGSIALLEENAFPVIMEPSGNRLIFEAAGIYKGDRNGSRAVLFAHEQFGHALNDGRMMLFENAIKWAARKSNPAEITIALSTNLPAEYFRSRGYQVRMADRNMKTNDFNPMPGADVLVVDFHGPYTERFMARASEFVAGGGGLVATFLPWRYVHRDIQPMFGRVNDLIKPFGLTYRSSLVSPVDFGFTSPQAEAYWPGVFNAFEAARMLRRQREGQAQLGSLEKAIALNTVAYAADRQPEMLSALTDVYSGSAGGVQSGEEGAGNFVEVARLNGAQAEENRSGSWQVEGSDLISTGERGTVEYSFTADEAGVYRVQIYGSQNLKESAWTNFNLVVRVDDVPLGSQKLSGGYGVIGQVNVLTPYVLGGTHKVKILWDNASSRTQLKLQGVRVQRATGADSDGDGINNWVEQRVRRQSGLDQTNQTINSYTSPLCLEGRDPYLDLMRADVSGADVSTPRLKPERSPNGRWFVNVPLALSGETGFRVSYQNGARSEVRSLKWVPVNVLDGGQFTVRKNDKFALIARPAGAVEGEMRLTIATTNDYPRRKVTSPLPYEFSDAGTFTVNGTYTAANGATQSGTITVKVVEHQFGDSPACWVGGEREWTMSMPEEATVESDSRLFFEMIGRLAGSGWRVGLMADENEDRYIVSRLGSHGPILDSGVVRGFEFWSGMQTYLRVVETYGDESQLVEMLLVMSPVVSEVSVRINLIVGGVLFEDGTITKELKAGAFDELGRCTVRFIRPAAAKTSVCHSIKVYQGTEVIGYVR